MHVHNIYTVYIYMSHMYIHMNEVSINYIYMHVCSYMVAIIRIIHSIRFIGNLEMICIYVYMNKVRMYIHTYKLRIVHSELHTFTIHAHTV